MKTQHTLKTLSALILGLGAMGVAHGSGFQLLEQNGSGLGSAYAGSAAIGENASANYFNPASITLLPGMNVSAGAVAIKPSFKFSNDGSTSPLGTAATGGNGGDAGSWAAVPNAHFTWEVNPRVWLGLSVGAPFGLMTDYEEGWAGRYHSEKFSIESINVNPSIAFKATDTLSFGVGVNWIQLDADYRKAVPGVMPAGGPGVPGYYGDLSTKVTAKGDAWGWNAGILWQATPDTRFGLSYRSKVKIDADGTTKISNRDINPSAGFGTGAGIVNALSGSFNAETSVELPDTAIFSVVHQLNDRWTLLGDVSWTGWSSIPRLTINTAHPNPAAQTSSLDLRFKDSWRVALGAHYRYSDAWTFKGGVAWDQSPVRDDAYRPSALPDNDRYWLSLGAQYNFSKNTSIDVGYTHLFVKSTSVNNASSKEAGVLKGDYDSSGDLIGVQFSHRF
ncbi:OmpP1/FadL family transporter [Castellaniella denitrificans]|uniref:OmpP1/FadL family transporter n=1 Tax=Castellaniella denitrificans TaxID=56119 RepID=UPI0036144E93